MLKNKILSSVAGQEEKLWVNDCFSTYLYTGNGATQTINNGIDLAGKGGLVWIKCRNNAGTQDNHLFDTNRGVGAAIRSNLTNAQLAIGTSLTSFNSDGFSIGSYPQINNQNSPDQTYASWTFRKAPKFFDCGTYTGNGVAGRQIPHSLGVAPGMIFIKCSSISSHWVVYANTLGGTKALRLNGTSSQLVSSLFFNNSDATSSTFTLGTESDVNGSGYSYVWYAFAHDPSADGIIQCGSFTATSTGSVNLGFEPQFVLFKQTNGVSDWYMLDSMRGFASGTSTTNQKLLANSSAAESGVSGVSPTATGFDYSALGGNWVYLAIRRPNKPPTTGAEVFAVDAAPSGSPQYKAPFPVDFGMRFYDRTGAIENSNETASRLAGNYIMKTQSTNAESPFGVGWDVMNGFSINYGSNSIGYSFRRAPGFFSSFAYTGTGANRTTPHDLAVIPDLLIVKSRSATGDWQVWYNGLAASEKLVLNSNAAKVTDATAWNSTLPTATNITVGTSANTNANGTTYIAYAFSSLPDIQKIGTYVGDGTSGRIIDCGFTTGSRFVCIKAVSTTGSWLVSDSARGIVAAADPYLQLNSTAAEVTTEDWLDQSSIGFIVNNVPSSNANASGVTYMYWAIS